MADRNQQKAAHEFIHQHGKAVAENLPGGHAKMGFGVSGPKDGKIAANAQAYVGNVPKGGTFAELQQGAMKKK